MVPAELTKVAVLVEGRLPNGELSERKVHSERIENQRRGMLGCHLEYLVSSKSSMATTLQMHGRPQPGRKAWWACAACELVLWLGMRTSNGMQNEHTEG